MGCRFGAALYRAGAEVCLYDVAKEHVGRINSYGLRIETQSGIITCRIPAAADVAGIPAPDVAIVFTKSMHTRVALSAVCGAFSPHTVVGTMQNGLGNIETISDFVERKRIIAGITSYACDLVGPGVIRPTGDGETAIMALSEENAPVAGSLAALLNKGGIRTAISGDVMISIWEKVAFNAALNTMTAITGLPIKYIAAQPDAAEMCFEIAAEVVKVARLDGVDADIVRVREKIAFALKKHGEHKPSMLQDREKKRPSEIDSIVKAVLDKADDHGASAPSLSCVWARMKTIESGYCG